MIEDDLILDESLSARRAWIEIPLSLAASLAVLSLSARRAWIEIEVTRNAYTGTYVALRKESVDRNPKKGQAK